MNLPPLDILLYCHDGRGMGHASRTIGIGMALRRLYPRLRVLFVSGFPYTREFCGSAPLDWLKLPAYETEVLQGISKGIAGKSNFSDAHQGVIRARTIEQYMHILKPRVVLADHAPQGKHKELLPALALSKQYNTKWILGVRGVIGAVKQVTSSIAQEIFEKFYSGLLWYGDSQLLGDEHCKELESTYGAVPYETGYVSRMAELNNWDSFTGKNKSLAGVVAIPWVTGSANSLLEEILGAIAKIDTKYGDWHVFITAANTYDMPKKLNEKYTLNENIKILDFGPMYHASLVRAKSALIFGGYNSLTDVLYSGVNTVVIEREMQDNEQQIHLERICKYTDGQVTSISEKQLSTKQLSKSLNQQLTRPASMTAKNVNLNGAELTARKLITYLS